MPTTIYNDTINPSEPIKCTCGNCGGVAWIIPIPQGQGSCLCSNCTFGEKGLSLADMLKRIFVR